MTDIGFYHLTRTSVAAALPALLVRTLAANQKALIRSADPSAVAKLDEFLWTSQDWLPHGTAATPHPEWQPIYLTEGESNPANAAFLFLLDGATHADLAQFVRVFDLFDGNDAETVAAARQRWTEAKAAGHAMTYWRQSETGWEKVW